MKKGVTVLYNKFGIGCVDIEMGGETYILIREEDLIGTFPGSGATANDIPKLTQQTFGKMRAADEIIDEGHFIGKVILALA